MQVICGTQLVHHKRGEDYSFAVASSGLGGLYKDIPEVDWDKEFGNNWPKVLEEWKASQKEILAQTMLMSGIGHGISKLKDSKPIQDAINNHTMMRALGFGEAAIERVQKAYKEQGVESAEKILQQEYGKRTEADIATGRLIAQEQIGQFNKLSTSKYTIRQMDGGGYALQGPSGETISTHASRDAAQKRWAAMVEDEARHTIADGGLAFSTKPNEGLPDSLPPENKVSADFTSSENVETNPNTVDPATEVEHQVNLPKKKKKNKGRLLDLKDLFDYAKTAKDGQKGYSKAGTVGPEEASILKQDTGFDFEGYEHTVDDSSIRHIMRSHGDQTAESARGQVAITEEDIQRIPEIIAKKSASKYVGKTKQGLDAIAHVTHLDGWVYYIEEVRSLENGELASKTMFKQKGLPAASDAGKPAPSLSSETLRSEAIRRLEHIESKVKSGDLRFSKRESVLEPGGTAQDYQAAANEFAKPFGNKVPIRVIENSAQLENDSTADIVRSVEQNGKIVEAYYDPKKREVVIFAENVTNEARLQELILHELVGHHGLQSLFQGELAHRYGKIILGLYETLNKLDFGPEWAGRHGYSTLKELALDYEIDTSTLAGKQKLIEEHLARVAETHVKPIWYKRAIAQIRDLLRQLFPGIRWTDNDVSNLLQKARETVIESSIGDYIGFIERNKKFPSEISFSFNDPKVHTFSDAIDKAKRRDLGNNEPVSLGDTPRSVRDYGAGPFSLRTTGGVIYKAKEKHGLDLDELKALPELLQKPVLILKNPSKDTRGDMVVYVNLKSSKGDPVFASIECYRRVDGIYINEISTIHAKDRFEANLSQWLDAGLLRYFDRENGVEWIRQHAHGQLAKILVLHRKAAKQTPPTQ